MSLKLSLRLFPKRAPEPPPSMLTPTPPALAIEASDWLVCLLDRDTRNADFTEWVTRSEAHEATFLRVCDSYKKTANLDSHHRIDIKALLIEYRNQSRTSIRAVPTSEARAGRGWFRWAVLAPSMSMILLALPLYMLLRSSSGQTGAKAETRTIGLAGACELVLSKISTALGFPTLAKGDLATRLGEHRCAKLPDESQICLNTNTVVRYDFDRKTRKVDLVSGEASFTVGHDDRPFEVISGGIRIHDLSTGFDVYKKAHSTQVTVIQGRVEVAPLSDAARLKIELAGTGRVGKGALEIGELQQVEYEDAIDSLHMRPALTAERLTQLLAWQTGRIDLNDRTLGEALDEFSRYQSLHEVRFSDPSIARIRVGGNMDVTHLDSFLAALEHEFHIHHTKTGTGEQTVITLTRR